MNFDKCNVRFPGRRIGFPGSIGSRPPGKSYEANVMLKWRPCNLSVKVEYTRATPKDYDELIDFGNLVFSQNSVPHDFPTLLPKLYKREYNTMSCHYIVKEDGKIKAALGSYPLDFHICGETIKGTGIGMVSVHPYSRSKGYMKKLMNMALEDMRKDGVELSCLGGQRQRYEYFGYTPCGTAMTFHCTAANARHKQGKKDDASLTLRQVSPIDDGILDIIYDFQISKSAYVERRRDRLYDILTSWNCKAFSIWDGQETVGYLLASPDMSSIQEIGLKDSSRLLDAISAYLFQFHRDSVSVSVPPQDSGKLETLKEFAESYRISTVYNFNVLDYPKVLSALLKLKCKSAKIEDGDLVIHVLDNCTFKLAVENNIPSVALTDEMPDLELSHLEAMQLFFSPITAFSYGMIAQIPFARSIFPLPLFFEKSDGV